MTSQPQSTGTFTNAPPASVESPSMSDGPDIPAEPHQYDYENPPPVQAPWPHLQSLSQLPASEALNPEPWPREHVAGSRCSNRRRGVNTR